MPPSPSYNHSWLRFDPKREVSPCHSTVTLSAVGTIEQSLKQGVKEKITQVESISSKDLYERLPIYFYLY